MVRNGFALACLALLAAGAGCAMCANPYDDCYPGFTGGCDGAACQGPRAGSIRATGGGVVAAPVEAPPLQAPPVPDEYYQQSAAARPRAALAAAHQARPAPPRPAPIAQSQAGAVRYAPAQQANPPARAQRDPRGQYQVSPDVWAAIPAEDRATAKVLSVTDRKADETAPDQAVASQPGNPLR